ncbi:galactose mutarotase [Bacillus sp. BGMRC 2118]|nr:galactose mutarotase [Bacillus sp. BGMRC 2118]
MENDNGLQISCMNYGCTITSILMPNRDGTPEEIVLGFDTIDEYLSSSSYFGCVIGRTAGRIRNAEFSINGITYSLSKNAGPHNLHGGPEGFHRKVWDSIVTQSENQVSVTFSNFSPGGEEGYPGDVNVSVTYTLTYDNELCISYEATTNSVTIVNLTNHTYFNLSGNLKENILHHNLSVDSNEVLEVDSSCIPTGKIMQVEGTVFDLRAGAVLDKISKSNHPQLALVGGGLDHPYLLNKQYQNEIRLSEKKSGRQLDIKTDEKCVVIYTGNSLEAEGEIRGMNSVKHLGLCLETQKPPNMINEYPFPPMIIDQHNPYISTTTYKFGLISD